MTPIPRKPHDAGSHDQQMTPAVQAVIDAADTRMPAGCTTPDRCRPHGCHGACLPRDMTPGTKPRPPIADRYAQAVKNEDGTLENFLVRIGGRSFRCDCGCNVFHKPDRKHLSLYQCNGCGQRFQGETE